MRAESVGGFPMARAKMQRHDTDERRVIYLEFVAASSIFFIVAMVLYMVFSYRPT